MTIVIAAITGDGKYIVTGSDRLISASDGTIPGSDTTLKSRKIARAWGLMFAGDADLFLPIVDKISERLFTGDPSRGCSLEDAQVATARVYRETFDERFASSYLVRYGYENILEFRSTGLAQLGSERFREICADIDRFDLGIQLIAYGFDRDNRPHIFQVDNPGTVFNHDLYGYAAIGSGYYMVSALLRRKRLPYRLNQVIYRVLEAKFSAETAPGVGRNTALLWMRAGDHESRSIGYGSIDAIRNVFEETLKAPEPEEAINIIAKLTAE
jgi:hypothetical protein